ncbi:MAG: U32 family peptidase [Lachnospiraceae bacterium]|nr:U32 family peptidase [Lachnospiraceae bacterium]
MEHRVELLAPAGNYEAFIGAINAGADAVYLGGEKFGARAYADNFSTEEICRALQTAHFMGRKIYLTVNTLLKESEFEELYDYILPFYEAGLDGVIVQDLGVFCYIRDHFKNLALHASTQMTLTGVRGAAFLKSQGAVRIVPARELSLEEVRRMKVQTDMEIECFIHGAMCYCYSGQCLFSSILGGRSGNRGRCAQPCRLPYQIYEKDQPVTGEGYPLSLKDMCTLSYIPELIEAGIDSFKIEGRMKKPEYAAGVTALYRKYIDRYYQNGKKNYQVEAKDLDKLRNLYIRSEIQTGYYGRHNSKDMITLNKPSYMGSDESVLNEIRIMYLHEPDKMPVKMRADVTVGEPLRLQIIGPHSEITVTGDMVEQAKKLPLQEADIRKQLLKTGNSRVAVSDCEITMQGEVFVPVRSLNQLRRDAVDAFEQQIIGQYGLTAGRQQDEQISPNGTSRIQTGAYQQPDMDQNNPEQITDCVISTYDQLKIVTEYPCRRIYIDSDLYIKNHKQVVELLSKHNRFEYALALPYVLRARDEDYLQRLKMSLKEDGSLICGFLIRNLEELAYVRDLQGTYFIVPDTGLYCFNAETIRFFTQYSTEFYLPYEVNVKEASLLAEKARNLNMTPSMVVYGRIPMMITANCLKKTSDRCIKGKDGSIQQSQLKDRYGTIFPVETNCEHCYNIIYNSVPYSLHLKQKEVNRIGAGVLRYDFIMESVDECRQILSGKTFPYKEYTTGHLKRGIE